MSRRRLWGSLEVNENDSNDLEKMVTLSAKRVKLEESKDFSMVKPAIKNVIVKVKNPYVTQTIEVMKQTEMLQSLIDTYSGSSNYLLNSCQMIPEVDFPPENDADFVTDEKFNKPIWFIPPIDTPFARAVPKHYPQINVETCKASVRKAVAGQLRVSGFNDTAESALILFSDAVEEYIRNLMCHIRSNMENELSSTISLKDLEKSYYNTDNSSFVQIHNYWRTLLSRNRCEIAEYKNSFHEYDKLMKESRSMQKDSFQEGDFLNILEMPQSSAQSTITQEVVSNENATVSSEYNY